MATSHIQELSKNSLYALQNVFELNGLASSYPANARGYSVVNCYLLKQEDGALLLDSGYTVHADSILTQIGGLLDKKTPLSIYPLRLNEFMSVCNVEAIAGTFHVDQCYSSNPDAALWVDFGGRSDSVNPQPYSLKTTVVSRAQKIYVGSGDQRLLEAFQAPIRLIATRWIYDQVTKTLFTSDSFTHEWRDQEDGPWMTNATTNQTSVQHVKSFLLNTRYWWLRGGDTGSLRKKLADIFEKYDIENIAPGYGCVIQGRELVKQQYQLLDDALRDFDKSQITPYYMDRDEVR